MADEQAQGKHLGLLGGKGDAGLRSGRTITWEEQNETGGGAGGPTTQRGFSLER